MKPYRSVGRSLMIVAALGGAACISGVADYASAGKSSKDGQAQSISASDKRKGAEYHPQLLAEFGGAYAGPQASYVTAIGRRIALQSGLSNSQSDFTVTLLNSPVENAFAIPGGYVYITRQLFALANDEAEVAGVMGHEVGHVAARHARGREKASTGAGLLSVLGQVAGAVLGTPAIGDFVNMGAQYMTARYSRSQETEADDLGVVYLTRAGYDPMAMSTMLASLAAATALEARMTNSDQEQMPRWASSHPDPGARVKRTAEKANKTGFTTGVRNRDAYIASVNGIRYDDDPNEGIVDGQVFRHGKLRITFTAPNGYVMKNGPMAVSIEGNGGQAEMTGMPYSGNMSAYINAAFSAFSDGQVKSVAGVQTGRVNGLKTAFATQSADTQSGPVDVTVYAFEISPTEAYHFVMLTPRGSGVGPFAPMIQSMRRLSTTEAAQIKGRRVQVVTVKAGDTAASLARRMAYSQYQLERFQVINALGSGASLTPGQKVKIITYSDN